MNKNQNQGGIPLKLEDMVLNSFEESVYIKKKFVDKYSKQIVSLSKEMAKRIRNGGGIFFMGNGGSAADAAHLAAELIGMFYIRRKPIKALSLSANPSILTEIPNDFGFEYLFERQIEAHVTSEDVVIGISTSGKSPNVLMGLKKAKSLNALTVGFTGKDGGDMNGLCDVIFKVDSDKTPRIQEVHIFLGHMLCQLVEYQLFGDEKA